MTPWLIICLAVAGFIVAALLLGWGLCAVSGRAERQAKAMMSRFVQDTQPNEDSL